jgi:hypothetical protein
MVRMERLELSRRRHGLLRTACLPIPSHPHIWCPWGDLNLRSTSYELAAFTTKLQGRILGTETIGAFYPNRTDDLLITSQLLYLLS